jgi:hypothetical protein
MKSLNKQEGGSHYRQYAIQPIEFIVANCMGFLAGNVVKYVTRYRAKNGAEDIRKAIHYLELILEFEYPTAANVPAPAAPTDLLPRLFKCPYCLGAGSHAKGCRGDAENEVQSGAQSQSNRSNL